MAQVSWPTQSVPLDQWDHESDESQRRRLQTCSPSSVPSLVKLLLLLLSVVRRRLMTAHTKRVIT